MLLYCATSRDRRRQQHQQLKHGRGEDGAVKPVEHAAVTGQQIAVVLHAVLTLDGGKRKVARLTGKAAEKAVDGKDDRSARDSRTRCRMRP